MQKQDIPVKKVDSREQEHLDAVKRLQERVALVKTLKTQGMGTRAIARQTGLSPQTVRTYLSETFVSVNGQYGKHREGKLQPYREAVLKLKSEGLKYGEIHKIIQAKGYSGGQAALRAFIAKERRIGEDIRAQHGNNPVELLDKYGS